MFLKKDTMSTKNRKYRYIEWLGADEMHEASVQWMSELNFVRDEQQFLNDLVKSHTLELLGGEVFDESRKIIGEVLEAEKEVVVLMKRVQLHENLLEIMVSDLDVPKMQKAYIETHWELTTNIKKYLVNYRQLKKRLFRLISKVMQKQKQKRLLN
jgi:uncharacterized protein YeeX (DUF496 family)